MVVWIEGETARGVERRDDSDRDSSNDNQWNEIVS
jgi:hypothetical protein